MLPENEVTTYLKRAFYLLDLFLANSKECNLQKFKRNMQQYTLQLEEAFLRVLQMSGYDIEKSLYSVGVGQCLVLVDVN